MLVLREALFSDHEAISKLHAESWRLHYRGIFSEPFLNDMVYEDRSALWYERLKAPENNQQVTVAVFDDSIVGFSCIYLNEDPVFGSLLDNLHVESTQQQSGIGKQLMQSCAKTILEKGDDMRMYLWVFEKNETAQKTYERWGGTRWETVVKENIDGSHARACRFVWEDVSKLI